MGNKDLQYGLALMYMEGKGTTKDLIQAIFWFQESIKGNKDEKKCKDARDAIEKLHEQHCWRCSKGSSNVFIQCSTCSIFYMFSSTTNVDRHVKRRHFRSSYKRQVPVTATIRSRRIIRKSCFRQQEKKKEVEKDLLHSISVLDKHFFLDI